jgi:phosphate transport system substrate-binding protein
MKPSERAPFRHDRMKAFALLFLSACLIAGPSASSADEDEDEHSLVRIVGSGAVGGPLSLAAVILHARGLETKLIQESSSTAAIAAVGDGKAEIAISIRPLTGEDRAPFPEKRFQEAQIGSQALAMVVPREVWTTGVRALSREQIRGIYEGKITNWKVVGGDDRPIKFFNPAQGRGVWEFFVTWLYGDIRKAPLGTGFETVNGGEETRNVVEFHSGSLSVAPPAFVDGRGVFALAVRDESGEAVEPTPKNIAEKQYPIVRPLLLVTGQRPTGDTRRVIEFMCGSEGQALVRKSEFVPLAQE